MTAQLEASLTKADSEQLARSIAEEQYSDLEKEKIMKELEIKDMMARHKQELGDKEATISSVRPLPPIRHKNPGHRFDSIFLFTFSITHQTASFSLSLRSNKCVGCISFLLKPLRPIFKEHTRVASLAGSFLPFMGTLRQSVKRPQTGSRKRERRKYRMF